jgi:hypothetical protein
MLRPGQTPLKKDGDQPKTGMKKAGPDNAVPEPIGWRGGSSFFRLEPRLQPGKILPKIRFLPCSGVGLKG